MRITNYFNTIEKHIKAKEFNILIGISLGNKYFSKENIKDYLMWALENTKEKVAILIPDKIHSINYEVRNSYSKEHAEKVAFRKGEEVKVVVESILKDTAPEKHSIVYVLKWGDIETEQYKFMRKILYTEFKKNKKFKNLILEISKEIVLPANKMLSESDYEKLATYLLEELPILISGIEYNGLNYNLLPYPGISKLDYLVIDLQEGKSFPEITDLLKISTKLKIIEAYAD